MPVEPILQQPCLHIGLVDLLMNREHPDKEV